MKKLLVYLKDYKRESVLGPLFKLFETFFELLVPLVIAAIIDTGIAAGDKSYIIRRCLLLVGLAVVGMVCSITAQYFAAKASVGFATKIRHTLFQHIQKLSYTELDTLETATLITRLTSDMNQVQTGMNLTLRLLLRSPFVVVGAMIMAFSLDVKAGIIFLAVIPVLTLVIAVIMSVCVPLYRKNQTYLDRVMGRTKENLSGVRVIRAFTLEEQETQQFEGQTQDLSIMQQKVGRISALMNPLTYVIVNLAVITLVWTGAIRVDTGILSQGVIVALYNYMSQILVELIKMANLIITITRSIASGNRIGSILEVTSSLHDTKNAPPTVINDEIIVVFDNVSLHYTAAGAEAISNISFTVRRGETIGIIGGTGSGKSSLINLIPRFYDATDGQIRIKGADIKDYPVDQLRGMIGIVPQQATLFKGSIRDNMRWGNKNATDDDILRALETAQASDFVAQREGGLDAFIEQGSKNLSGGQRQRLTIARALVRQPEILILDDSASALDYATDASLRTAIRNLPGEMTVFIVSQRASSIQYADRILVLEKGKIVGSGTHQDLLERCDIYREIYETQFQKEGA